MSEQNVYKVQSSTSNWCFILFDLDVFKVHVWITQYDKY